MNADLLEMRAGRAEALAELCQRFRVRQLDLFGSAVDGRWDGARSDLDFLVSFEAADSARYAQSYFGLLEGLTALFERDVDLVTEASLENPYLRRSIERGRRQVFPAAA